jgi:hypothetical protein
MKSAGRRAANKKSSSVVNDSGRFALEVRIRGKADRLRRETCQGLEDAIRIGEKWFRAFRARNPWFVQDSKQKRIFILLDPETENMMGSEHRRKSLLTI